MSTSAAGKRATCPRSSVELTATGCHRKRNADSPGWTALLSILSSKAGFPLIIPALSATTNVATSAIACQRCQVANRCHWSCPISTNHLEPGCCPASVSSVSMVKVGPARFSSSSDTSVPCTSANAKRHMASRWGAGLSAEALCQAWPVGMMNNRSNWHWAAKACAIST